MYLFILCLYKLTPVAANGTGIYAVVAFPVPSVFVKDIKADFKSEAGNMHVSHHCMNTMLAPVLLLLFKC